MEFRQTVEEAGRKKLIMTALWTEACLTFHNRRIGRGLRGLCRGRCGRRHFGCGTRGGAARVEQADVKMISVPQLFCKLQRDLEPQGDRSGFHGSVHRDGKHCGNPVRLRQGSMTPGERLGRGGSSVPAKAAADPFTKSAVPPISMPSVRPLV